MDDRDGHDYQYVVKATELGALHHMPHGSPKPMDSTWINRATGKKLRPTSIDMLMRTLHLDVASRSVVELQRTSGLRISFKDEADRLLFSRQFDEAKELQIAMRRTHASAVFETMQAAKATVGSLIEDGVDESAISLLWRANLYLDPAIEWHRGHGTLSIVSSTAGGGATGVAIVLGLTLLPGFGQFVAAGAAAGATLSTVTSLGGIIGATGGAIAKMLTDQDVDGTAANFYESQIDRGKIVLSVSLKHTDISEAFIRRVLRESGGHIYSSL